MEKVKGKKLRLFYDFPSPFPAAFLLSFSYQRWPEKLQLFCSAAAEKSISFSEKVMEKLMLFSSKKATPFSFSFSCSFFEKSYSFPISWRQFGVGSCKWAEKSCSFFTPKPEKSWSFFGKKLQLFHEFFLHLSKFPSRKKLQLFCWKKVMLSLTFSISFCEKTAAFLLTFSPKRWLEKLQLFSAHLSF